VTPHSPVDYERDGKLTLKLLGSIELTGVDGTPIEAVLAQSKRFALLTYLAIAEPAGFHRRDTLTGLFWSRRDEKSARRALRQALSFLRKHLGANLIETRADAVRLNPDTIECDVVALQQALDQTEPERGLELFRGPLLSGFYVRDATGFEKWLDAERQRIEGSWISSLEQAAKTATETGQHATATRWWRTAAAVQPLCSRTATALAESLRAAGNRAGALKAATEHVDRLRDELDLEPDESFRALVTELRTERSVSGESGTALQVHTALPVPTPVAVVPAPHRSPTTTRRTFSRPFVLASAAAVSIMGSLALWGSLTPGAAVNPKQLLIFPSTYSGNPELSYLRDAFPHFLGPRIDGAGDLSIVDPNRLDSEGDLSTDLRQSRRAAAALGAGQFLISRILESDGVLQASATLYSSDGRAQHQFTTGEHSTSDLGSLVDELGRSLLVELGGAAFAARMAPQLTESLDAARHYLEAEEAQRRGDDEQARAAYLAAIEADSTFGLARVRLLASEAFSLGGGPVDTEALERSRATLPFRYQMVLDGELAQDRAQATKAEQVARDYIHRYPDDPWGYWRLGDAISHYGGWLGRSAEEGNQALDRAMALDSTWLEPRAHRMWTAVVSEDFALAQSEMEKLVRDFPTSVWGRAASVALKRLDGDEAGTWVDIRSGRAGAGPFLSTVPFWYTDDPENLAVLLAEQVAATPAERSELTRTWLAGTRLALGDLDGAEQAYAGNRLEVWPYLAYRAYLMLTPMIAISGERLSGIAEELSRHQPTGDLGRVVRAHLLGQLAVRRDLDGAPWADSLITLAAKVDPDLGPLARSYAALVRVHGALRSGGSMPDLKELNGSLPEVLASNVTNPVSGASFERWLRGEVALANGDLVQAAAWYSMLGRLPDELHFAPPKHVRLAEIAERNDDIDAAVWHYRRVLRYWSEGSPPVAAAAHRARGALSRLGADQGTPGSTESYASASGSDLAIAVLPLDPGPAGDTVLASGFTEEIIDALRDARFRVPARSAVGTVGEPVSARDAVDRLAVDFVLEAGFRRTVSGRVLAAELHPAGSKYPVWQQQYPFEDADILSARSQIPQSVAGVLGSLLPASEHAHIPESRAYAEFVRGLATFYSGGDQTHLQSIESLERAVELDPSFAEARGYLAAAHALAGVGMSATSQTFVRADGEAKQALALDPDLSMAHAARGLVALMHDWNWPAARQFAQAALERDSRNPIAHLVMTAYYVSQNDRDAAAAQSALAVQSNEFDQQALLQRGWSLIHARRYEGSIAALRELLEHYPDQIYANVEIMWNHVSMGQCDQALPEAEAAEDLVGFGDDNMIAMVGWAYAECGDRENAERIGVVLEAAARTRYVDPINLAIIQGALGETDAAFESLRRSISERSGQVWLLAALRSQHLRSVGNDPRYADLLRELDLPSDTASKTS